jgi:hypothetical protein
MASEYLRSDEHGLLLLAELIEAFWREPSTKLASEIRLQGQGFGLTPIDRRRLQWEVQRVEQEGQRRRPAPPPTTDPRRALHAV